MISFEAQTWAKKQGRREFSDDCRQLSELDELHTQNRYRMDRWAPLKPWVWVNGKIIDNKSKRHMTSVIWASRSFAVLIHVRFSLYKRKIFVGKCQICLFLVMHLHVCEQTMNHRSISLDIFAWRLRFTTPWHNEERSYKTSWQNNIRHSFSRQPIKASCRAHRFHWNVLRCTRTI